MLWCASLYQTLVISMQLVISCLQLPKDSPGNWRSEKTEEKKQTQHSQFKSICLPLPKRDVIAFNEHFTYSGRAEINPHHNFSFARAERVNWTKTGWRQAPVTTNTHLANPYQRHTLNQRLANIVWLPRLGIFSPLKTTHRTAIYVDTDSNKSEYTPKRKCPKWEQNVNIMLGHLTFQAPGMELARPWQVAMTTSPSFIWANPTDAQWGLCLEICLASPALSLCIFSKCLGLGHCIPEQK